jgi:hypothetical protein
VLALPFDLSLPEVINFSATCCPFRRVAPRWIGAFRPPTRYTALATPVSWRNFAPGQLQFITSSAYRRTRLFESRRFRCDFVEVLWQFGQETGFLLVGWVLMPEHFQRLVAFAGGMVLIELQVLVS